MIAWVLIAALAAPDGEPPDGEPPPDPERFEIAGMPALGYDSNTGFAFGALVDVARYLPGHDPFAWHLEAQAYLSVLERGGNVDFPMHEHHLRLDLPSAGTGKLRLTAEAGFSRRLSAGYYGAANPMRLVRRPDDDPNRFAYDWLRPYLSARGRVPVARLLDAPLEVFGGAALSYEQLTPYPGSVLSDEAAAGAAPVGLSPHVHLSGVAGALWDGRDHETTPSRGGLHEVSLRFGAGHLERFAYGGVNATLRLFVPLWGSNLVLAGRLLADVLFGTPPLYELARYGGLFAGDATGGATSVRGVLGQRYQGALKLLGNLELRGALPRFELFGQRWRAGAVLFCDGLSVWRDPLAGGPEGGAALAAGLGGGARLQWGETFVLRADFAWAPVDDTLGIYIDVGHAF